MSTRQRLVLTLLLGAQFMLAVDFSILNVALPDIGHALGLSLGGLQWIATAFALPAAGFTLLFGRVADLFGRRRMFMAGLLLLMIGSLAGGLSNGQAMLLTGRVLQGLATALATPAALSLLTTSFPEGPLRRRALGLNGALMAAGFAAGALFGGVLTQGLSWRWTFLVNAPVAAVLLVAAPVLLAADRERSRVRLDVPGAITVTGGLLSLVYGVTQAGHVGWSDPVALIAIGAGVLLLALFGLVETRAAEPLASMRVLTRRTVGWGNLGGFTVFAMETAMVFLLTIYLQNVLGYSALVTGLVFGVPGVTAAIAGVVGPRLIGRIGAHTSLVLGLAVQAISNLALLALGTDRGTGLTLVLVTSAIGFFGHVYGIVAFTVTATSGLPDDEQGLATGLTTMSQQIAFTLGIPVIGAVAAARTGSSTAASDLLSGMRLAIGVDVALTVLVVVLIAFFLLRAPRRTPVS
ncbi:MFS transporter [Actinomadura harenae]|uniref:MFS transporter n=2 Tax=Actinomadura harenae TaxID=2483351 RepID=A0A3M2LIQ2_9ACTN|nr:MFS transporter [Actinomadura harenae]